MTDTTERIEPPLHQQLSTIDAPMERKRVGDMTITKWAGLTFSEYREAIEFAKLMAGARNSIPGYLKQNAGDCLAIITQSLRWRLEPYWVAQHSYVVKAESLITYDSAVHAAILLSSGLLKGRPRYEYEGEGDERRCTVIATFVGESTPHEYTTPPLKQCIKNSPLWKSDPDQQLGYYAIRNWGRRHAQEVLGGVYDRDEFENATQDDTPEAPASPNLISRLPGKIEGAGFSENVVDASLAEDAAKVETEKPKRTKKSSPPGPSHSEAARAGPFHPEPPQSTPRPEATEKAKEGVSEADPSQTISQAESTAPEPPRQPETAGEYHVYAEAWIKRVNSADDLEARWDGESELRANLKVPLALRKRLEAELRTRISELRQPKRRK